MPYYGDRDGSFNTHGPNAQRYIYSHQRPTHPSFGPGADITPRAQARRARETGTKPLPWDRDFVWDARRLPRDFFDKAMHAYGDRLLPDHRFLDGEVALFAVGGLLYYAQTHMGPQTRRFICNCLRYSNAYDGDLLEALMEVVGTWRMRCQCGKGKHGDEDPGEGWFYGAEERERAVVDDLDRGIHPPGYEPRRR